MSKQTKENHAGAQEDINNPLNFVIHHQSFVVVVVVVVDVVVGEC